MSPTDTDLKLEPTLRRILVVEDEETLAAGVREALEHQKYTVETVYF
jgi:CheY-like chemotaxis protein